MLALATAAPVGWLAPHAAQDPSPLPAALANQPGISVAYYDVRGATARDIRSAINAVRPTEPHHATPVDAYADIRWYWRWPTSSGGCDLASAQVRMQVTVLLPRLENIDALPVPLQQRWRGYLEALGEHEAGHIAIARRSASAIRDAIAASDCRNANKAARSAAASIQLAQIAYDRETRHGKAQGATFP
ncbi:DUF922 domain-containing protein [Stakelama tenebrarum]|uniref:DUF922 domain-containing Zn-dependent protease n=1 Tax=Stakelama tenebrarum TaxID=2711215 RepID=A0A6G6Y454_9SPHN|nr:DUF922 domain-containing protein [Sphingosinithalassobacter tenebrarum]QIG79712.1 DUF922 domain-containing Zn-dependent protease [Sphingosinithalassobacter tenebrarum]